MTLNDKQQEAVDLVMNGNSLRILGAPGVGKTAATQFICRRLLDSNPDINIIALAPSHSAKAILKNNIDNRDVQTKTIQSHCNFKPKFINGEEVFQWTYVSPKKPDVCIIDEISMLSQEVWNVAQSMNCQFIFLGDDDQFKSVASQQADLSSFESITLTENMRLEQKNSSLSLAIAEFRDAIHEHRSINIADIPNDDTFQRVTDKNQWINHLTKDRGSVVICSMNDNVNAYNKFIKEQNNGKHFEKGDIMVLQKPWWEEYSQIDPSDFNNGDTVELINIEDIDDRYYSLTFQSSHGGGIFSARTPKDPKFLKADLNELATKAKKNPKLWGNWFKFKNETLDIKHIHSMTAWKTQGSTFDTVLIDMKNLMQILQWGGNEDKLDMFNRAGYVALSRARKKAILYI